MRAIIVWCAIAATLAACGSDPGGGGAPCTLPAECPGGETCEGGHCVPVPPCTGPADCIGADFCSANGTCIPDGTCAVDDDCLPGMVCDPNHACVPDGSCGATELTIAPIAPNVLIVLDRSCSMRNPVGGVPKWTSAVTAINQLTTNFDDEVRWGLTMFPDTMGGNCGQAAIPIPVAPGNAPTIQTLLTASLATTDVNYPDGPCVTNIDTAMEQAATEPAFGDPMRPSFAMLVTDGAQAGCSAAGGDNGTEMILADLATRGVLTFVVGFGGATDVAQMDMFAVAGGTALPVSPRFYQADDATELEAAFATIADLVIGCDFVLTDPPADLAELFAFFNNAIAVPRDVTHLDGWDYDPATMTLTFYGSYCTQLQSGSVTDVDIVYGCEGPTPD